MRYKVKKQNIIKLKKFITKLKKINGEQDKLGRGLYRNIKQ